MSNDTIIRVPADTAGQSQTFTVGQEPMLVYIYPAANLTASEYVDLQRESPAGTFEDVYDIVGGSAAQVRLDTTRTSLVIDAPGTYRLDFDNPTNAVGAAIAVASQKR